MRRMLLECRLSPVPLCGQHLRRIPCPKRKTRCKAKRTVAGHAAQTAERVLDDFASYVMPVYVRPKKVFVSGSGSHVVDSDGMRYLDFSGGIAVNALGHADRRVIDAMTKQAEKIIHTSNLFHSEPAIELSKRLVENSFADKVFVCNSGTEATEAAIKFSRKWASVKHGVDPYDPKTIGPHEIVSFTSAFHGRTIGAMSITPKERYQSPFLPLMPGHRLATFNDLESAKKVIQAGKTCAVIVEPVQGEGGVHPASQEFLEGLRSLCDENGCLLIFDEVQCGLGRTGKLWAHLHYGVNPDIMTLAKPLGGGLPIGAVCVTQDVAEVMQPGDHASTFAGNAVVCSVANTVFDIIRDPSFLQHVQESSEYMSDRLQSELLGHSSVVEIRHLGLLFGIQCKTPVTDIVAKALELGLVVITAGAGDVLRMAPPLNISQEEIDECIEKLIKAFN